MGWTFEMQPELPKGCSYKPLPPSLKMKRKRYNGIGICIYCFKEFPQENLTDEHIVPKALRGTLIFKNAVCEPCRKTTGREENIVLKEDFLVPRIILNLNYKDLPLPPVAIPNADPSKEIHDIYLTAEDYPKLVTVCTFPVPGHLMGQDSGDGASSLRFLTLNLEGYSVRTKPIRYSIRSGVTMGALLMLMAKVGYSYAVAELGVNYFDSTDIRDLLLDRRNDVFNFVGSPENTKRISVDLHSVKLDEQNGFVVALVNLFSSIHMYPYIVVLGKKI